MRVERAVCVFNIVLAAAVGAGAFAHGAYGWAAGCALGVAVSGGALRGLVRSRRRDERLRHGCCPACGYDLRHTPHRCPECGHVPPHGVQLAFGDWLSAEFAEVRRRESED